MHARTTCGLLLLALPILVGGPARAAPPDDDPYGTVIEGVRRDVRRGTVERATAAVLRLDPENPRSLPELISVLASGHWFVRGTAIELVAAIPSGPLRSELRLHLLTHDDPWVREGVAYAMAAGPVEGDAEALVAAADDPDWRVRRTAARALGEIVSRDGVARLVRLVEEDDDLRVRVWARASLRAVSQTDQGRDPRRWRAWWERHKDRPEWGTHGEEVTREEFGGVPLETVTVDTDPPGGPASGDGTRREKPEVFVLSPFGYSHGWFRPYLDEASDFVRLTYVTLPTVQEITGSSGYGSAVPVYPVEKLAKALDALRESRGKEQIIVLAAGPVAWIAESYAQRYPKRAAGLILVNGWLDRQSYAGALSRLYAQGTASERWASGLLLGEIENEHTPEEGRRMRRIFLTHTLEDRRDSEAWRLWKTTSRDHGFVVVPPLVFTRHTRIETPTLFTFPDDSPFGGGTPEDLRRIRASFRDPPPVTAVLRDSRGMAHVEDPAEFLRVFEGFLKHAKLID